MKICQVLFSIGEGGLEKHVRDLSTMLSQAGHDVVVIADQAFLASLPQNITGYPLSSQYSRWHPLLYIKLLRLLKKIRPDIVHAQANKAAHIIAYLRPFLACPTIGTLHNIKRNISAFKKLDHVINVSHQLAQSFTQDHCSVIYNGIKSANIPTQYTLTTLFDLSLGKPTFVTVGRLVKAKGFDMLLKAVDGLKLNLLIIGEGPEHDELKAQANTLNHQTTVRFLGYRDDVPALIAASDGVLISSRREGFSYVLSEALLASKPVLSTNVPVANEVLAPELICPVDDSDTFRSTLTQCIADTARWQMLMQAAFTQAQSSMTLESMSKATVHTYQAVLKEHGC